tara:strand:+ start:355 stop:822 length:468 start_codon:yes stop_codon:yes gene_type:complete
MSDNNHRTSINLDDETSEIAKRLGNRSEFVRECLRRWNAWDTKAHVHPTISDKCFPLSRKGCCALCWPDGPPDLPEWKYYLESGGRVVTGQTPGGNPIFAHNVPYNNKWIEEKARENNKVPHFPIPTEEQFRKSRKSPKTLGVLGHLRKLFRVQK